MQKRSHPLLSERKPLFKKSYATKRENRVHQMDQSSTLMFEGDDKSRDFIERFSSDNYEDQVPGEEDSSEV